MTGSTSSLIVTFRLRQAGRPNDGIIAIPSPASLVAPSQGVKRHHQRYGRHGNHSFACHLANALNGKARIEMLIPLDTDALRSSIDAVRQYLPLLQYQLKRFLSEVTDAIDRQRQLLLRRKIQLSAEFATSLEEQVQSIEALGDPNSVSASLEVSRWCLSFVRSQL